MLQVISFSVHFINLFFLWFKFISIHYPTIPKNKAKQKITEIKKKKTETEKFNFVIYM